MNALVSSGIVFGITKGYGIANTLEVPMSVYTQAAAIMGASKIIADVGAKDTVSRAIAAGAIYAGTSYAVFNDQNWALNAALGSISSYIADITFSPPHINEDEEDTADYSPNRRGSVRK
jgi:hypothetical protein